MNSLRSKTLSYTPFQNTLCFTTSPSWWGVSLLLLYLFLLPLLLLC
jgi:hypothetical protein